MSDDLTPRDTVAAMFDAAWTFTVRGSRYGTGAIVRARPVSGGMDQILSSAEAQAFAELLAKRT